MPYQNIPLTEDERELLYVIFNTRLKVLASGLLLFIFGIIYVLARAIPARYYSIGIRDFPWYKMQGPLFICLALALIIISYFATVFFRNVYPFYKDYKCGEKEVVPYTITRKLDFPITNQYFIGLDDPKYRNHEVDQDFYYRCSEGDTVKLYRAIHSKYVFEKDGRFTLL